MNVGGFIVHGLLFLLGAVIVTRSCPTPVPLARSFMLAAAANALGNILVGTFHSGTPQPAVHWHVIGAGLAILGGNAAVVIAGFGSLRGGAAGAYCRVSIALGVVGIASLAALVLDGSHTVPVGILERGSVYPIIAWELMTGIAILCRRSSRTG